MAHLAVGSNHLPTSHNRVETPMYRDFQPWEVMHQHLPHTSQTLPPDYRLQLLSLCNSLSQHRISCTMGCNSLSAQKPFPLLPPPFHPTSPPFGRGWGVGSLGGGGSVGGLWEVLARHLPPLNPFVHRHSSPVVGGGEVFS